MGGVIMRRWCGGARLAGPFAEGEWECVLLREAGQLPGELAAAIDSASLRLADCDFADEVPHAQCCGLLLEFDLQPYLLRSGCLLVDVAAMDEAAIDAMRLSAVGALTLRFLQFRLRSDPTQSASLIAGWTHLVAELLEHPRGRDVVTALFSWFLAGVPDRRETLRTVMNKIDEENPPMRSALDLLLDMGHERGLQQGVALLRSMVQRQLRARFGELGDEHCRRLAAADAEEIQAIGERLATAMSLRDVFVDGAG